MKTVKLELQPYFWRRLALTVLFLLLGIWNYGKHPVADAIDFVWCGYFLCRFIHPIAITVVNK